MMNCVFKYILFLVSSIILVNNCKSQPIKFSGWIKDKKTDEQIPFASVVFKKSGRGQLTDSLGKFEFSLPSCSIYDTIEVYSVGYQKVAIPINEIKDAPFLTISLEVLAPVFEAVVKVKYNRALWFWKKIMNNKFRSDKKYWDNYSYEIYNKLEMDLDNVHPEKLGKNRFVKPLNFIFNYIDSSSETKPFLPVYLTETLSDYYYQKDPEKIYEQIKATKTNGIENESFIKELGGAFQNINVMNGFIPVFNLQFISPFHTNADFYYKFKLADTAYLNGKRLVHLFFSGRRKGENTFVGDCWVHDSSFALHRITLRPSSDANINFVEDFTLLQEFRLINDTTWFLYKDKFVANIAPLGSGKLGFKGRKTTTYNNVLVNNDLILNKLQLNKKNIQVDLLAGSNNFTDSFWLQKRHEPLNKSEKIVYNVLDTLNKNATYLFYKDAIEILAKGTKDIGNVRFGSWYYWVSGNKWEGPRFRFDLATNKGFSDRWNFSGYAAYGLDDEKMKGKIQAKFLLDKEFWSYISLSYKSDIDNRQSYYDQMGNDNLFATIFRRPDIPIKFQFIKETKIEYFRETNSGMSLEITASDKNYTALLNLPSVSNFSSFNKNAFHSVETSIKFRYAFQERFVEDNFNRVSLGSKYPIAEFKYSKSIQGILNSQNDYHKIDFSVKHNLGLAPYGNIYWNVFAGKTFGTTTYPFLNILPGNELYYYNKFAFNLMNQFEYIADGYSGFNVEHTVGNGLFRYIGITRKLKFRQFWNIKGIVAGLSDKNKQVNFVGNYLYKSLNNKMYIELGTGVDNILKFFRIDFVWRVAPQPLASEKIKNFGIFGSYRFTF